MVSRNNFVISSCVIKINVNRVQIAVELGGERVKVTVTRDDNLNTCKQNKSDD